MDWRSLPPDREPVRSPPTGRAWAPAVVPLALYARVLEVPGGSTGWLLGWAVPIGVLGLVFLLLARRRTWLVVPAAAGTVLVATVLLPSAGPQVATVLVLGCLVWGEGLGVLRIVSPRLAAGRPLWPALAPAALAAALLVLGRTLWVPAALLAVAALLDVAAALLPRAADRALVACRPLEGALGPAVRSVGGWIDRLAEAVGRVVRVVVMVPAMVTVTVLWLIHRLVGHDPLRSPSGPDTRWVERVGTDRYPQRQHGGGRTIDRRSARERLSATGVVGVVGLVVVGVVVLTRPDGPAEVATPPIRAAEPAAGGATAAACEPAPANPVLSRQEDYDQLACDQSRAFAHGEYDPPSGYRMSDYSGPTLNMADGVRRTWTPPRCDCRRLTVWWFGGSAAWGEGQRDDRTIPSMLARRAWKDGIALDIENRAMPTWTFGQEVHAFADQLSRGGRPDLVVFYTGGNDLVFQGLRMLEGRPDDSSDIVLQQRYFSDLLRKGIPVRPAETEWSPDPATFEQVLTSDAARSLAPAVTSRLDRNMALAQLLGKGSGTDVTMIFQPLLAGSGPGAGPEGVVDPTLLASFTDLVQLVARDLPPGAEDMSGVYADVDEPVFFDLFHTGERGAAIAAERVFERLRPQLVERRDGDGG